MPAASPWQQQADAVWNRAASLERGGPHARPGDRALADLLLAHGMIMNGGVLHCLETLSAEELRDAAAGYRYYGLSEVGDLLSEAQAIEDQLEQPDSVWDSLDRRYDDLAPSDSALAERFEARYAGAPQDFAPP